MPTILIRYGESALKSNRIRKKFNDALTKNIEEAFLRKGQECLITQEWGRVFLETGNWQAARSVLKNMFGIVSFSKVEVVDANREEISKTALELIAPKVAPGKTFAVRCRRKGTHEFTSQQMAAGVGEDIYETYNEKGLSVNLSKPGLVVEVEIRDNRAYVFMERVDGPGGFPLGTQGMIAGLVENDDLDDPERLISAFYLMMKRGLRIKPFLLDPKGADRAKVEGLNNCLNALDPFIRMNESPELDEHGVLGPEHVNDLRAAVSARDVSSGVMASSIIIFYPLIGLTDEVLGKYTLKIKDLLQSA